MKKYAFLSALTLWVTLCVAHSSIISPVLTLGRGGVNSGVPATPAIPNLIAGVNAPMGQTPAMPSVSTEVPRCLDATWGAGCNVATQKCIAPTIGTPYQPCQPPQMLFPTGGTSNGTTGQIFYTSYASWTYPVGEAILIGNTGATHQATQANWNTPRSEVTAFASSGSGCTGGTFPVTLTINDSAAANPYATTGINSTVYVGGVTGSITGVYQSFGWTAGNPNGQYTVVAVGGSAGAWTLTYCTAIKLRARSQTILMAIQASSRVPTSRLQALATSAATRPRAQLPSSTPTHAPVLACRQIRNSSPVNLTI